jgi:DHA1 family multidrug resistance protein-like MFS transporter
MQPKEKTNLLPSRQSKSVVYNRNVITELNEGNPTGRSRSFTYRFYPEVTVLPVEDERDVADSKSIFLMIFINFLSNVVFSIVLPTLPFFLEAVGAPDYLNGWAVSANSLGTFLASPLFGWWADKRTFREVFIVSLVLMVVGNIWYALADNEYHIFAARFVVGVAAANYAPASSYLSYATSTQSRAKIMSWNAASSVLGFICGPAFSLLTSLPELSFSQKIGSYTLNFNANTAPGWVSAFFSLLGMLCLIPFKEVNKNKPTAINEPSRAMPSTSIRSFRSLSMINKSRIPMRGVVVCLFFCFSFTVAFTIFETTCPLYTKKWYGFNDMKNSLLFLGVSLGCLVFLAVLQILLKFIPDERVLLTIFGVIITGGMLVLFDWNNGYVSLVRFFIGVGFTSFGYADGSAILIALFSKILDEKEQGMMMGWFSSAGAIARMTAPIAASYIFNLFSENYIFISVAVLLFFACSSTIFGWDALDPNRHRREDSSFTH